MPKNTLKNKKINQRLQTKIILNSNRSAENTFIKQKLLTQQKQKTLNCSNNTLK